MLQGARPRTRLDSDAMFFSATNAARKTIRVELYGLRDDGFELGQIGQFLIGYSYVSGRKRDAFAREIEAKASALSKRVR